MLTGVGYATGNPPRPMPHPQEQITRLENLLEVGRSLTAELNLSSLLESLLTTARELTGARFAAIGVLDDRRRALEQFHTSGIPPEVHAQIGDLPRGRGILGLLIDDPEPLLVRDVTTDVRSAGFPPGHPPMHGFLGVPIRIRGEAWGNLYLTEKANGAFDQADVETVQILARWAAIAIENARLFAQARERQEALERANTGLEATIDVALAIGDAAELQSLLGLIAQHARAVVEASSVVLLTHDDHGWVVSARDDTVARAPQPTALPPLEPLTERALSAEESVALQLDTGRASLLVPVLYRGTPLGALVAAGVTSHDAGFSEPDLRALRSLAASAATALTTAQSVAAGRLRATLAASEGERRRWARELHDETLQGLGALRLALRGAQRSADEQERTALLEQAVDQLDHEIAGLRGIIHDLRPAALDDLGLASAMRALADRTAERTGTTVQTQIALGDERLDPELETVAYRITQEALTNTIKHAGATLVIVELRREDGELRVRVRDNGTGFEPEAPTRGTGLGLTGMQERAALVGGTVAIASTARGTTVTALLPLRIVRSADAPH